MVLEKFPQGKFPPRKFPFIKPLLGKLSLRNFLTLKIFIGNSPTHFIRCISSLNTSFINGGKRVHHLSYTKNFDISRPTLCSNLRKNSNNQCKLTMSSGRFPS